MIHGLASYQKEYSKKFYSSEVKTEKMQKKKRTKKQGRVHSDEDLMLDNLIQ